MGGKSKIVDTNKLSHLYAQNHKFKKVSAEEIENIKREINILESPDFQEALVGGQGEAIKEAIASISKSIGSIEERTSVICKFIDSKIGGAAILNKDKHGFADNASAAKTAVNNLKR